MKKKTMKDSKTNYDNSRWADDSFVNEYLRDADIYIPQRKQVLQLIKSIFSFYVNKNTKRPYIIDLGCGDGAITKALLEINKNLLVTLVDGSKNMLESARKNIPDTNIKNAINLSFQDLFNLSAIEDDADFIVSSLAIHHLNENEKDRLFKYVYKKLKTGGLFVNYDPVSSPSQELERLDLIIWKKWILNYEAKIRPKRKKSLDYIPLQYKNNKDNVPSSIESQLEMMKKAGFSDVNLYYKYGLFCLFGGRK
ncbi:MAG: class I SAM-dependent methyltransferase [Bacteroidota bacterium]